MSKGIDNKEFVKWFHNLLMYALKGFIPWILFSLTIFKLSMGKRLNLTFIKICYLFVAYAIINSFSYELSTYIRSYVLGLVLIPCDPERKFFFESILGIGLIAFSFIVYCVGMVGSLKLMENKDFELL